MKIDLNGEVFCSTAIICFTIWVIFFCGDPDLMDSIIFYIMSR